MAQQNPKKQRITLTVQARILDWAGVAQEALDLGAPACATPADQVALVVMELPAALSCLTTVTPAHARVYQGAEGDCWSVSATFDVLDADALVAAAKTQTREVWLAAAS